VPINFSRRTLLRGVSDDTMVDIDRFMHQIIYVRFQVLTAANIKMAVSSGLLRRVVW
jgi:hypothetical protein